MVTFPLRRKILNFIKFLRENEQMLRGRNVECLTDSFVSVQFTLPLFRQCFSKKRLARQNITNIFGEKKFQSAMIQGTRRPSCNVCKKKVSEESKWHVCMLVGFSTF